jgi:hypothetical protein
MQISALREEVVAKALSFAWDQWAQLGLLTSPRRQDRWAMDPEALILFTLEVARRDPRLFDEMLDWLVVNERLVSVQRLRNLVADPAESALVNAALAWAGMRKPRTRLDRQAVGRAGEVGLTQLFPGLTTPLREIDATFGEHGFAKPTTERSQKSRPPDVDAPINFAFRLRYLLGVSVRAEVMRCLLTLDAPRVSAQVIARSAGYSKRNVQEALNALGAARAIISASVGSEASYTVDHSAWAPLFRFAPGHRPTQRDWPQLLRGLRQILQWVEDPKTAELSEYLLVSRAADLLERIEDDLRFAGVRVEPIRAGRPQEAWDGFVRTVRGVLELLDGGPPR